MHTKTEQNGPVISSKLQPPSLTRHGETSLVMAAICEHWHDMSVTEQPKSAATLAMHSTEQAGSLACSLRISEAEEEEEEEAEAVAEVDSEAVVVVA